MASRVQNLYLDNMEATGFYRVALTEAQPGDVLLCSFGSWVPNHAAISVATASCCTIFLNN